METANQEEMLGIKSTNRDEECLCGQGMAEDLHLKDSSMDTGKAEK